MSLVIVHHGMSEFEDQTILDRIHNLDATAFERFVAALWELQGWTTERTPRSGDGGRDITAVRTIPFPLSIKIEVKGWHEDPIRPSDVRQYSLLPGDDTDLAVMVTTATLTDAANRAATRHNLKIVNRQRLITLIEKLGAEPLLTDEFTIDDWEQVQSDNHVDWVVDDFHGGESVTSIPGIGELRAEQLATAGIHTVGDLASAAPADLAAQTGIANSRIERWVNLVAFDKGGEPICVITEIDQQAVESLAEVDIYTVTDLQDACPKELADQTGLDEWTLKQWVAEAITRDAKPVTDLPRIGAARAEELAKAGIFTVKDLAHADPDTLARHTNLSKPFLRKRIHAAQTVIS